MGVIIAGLLFVVAAFFFYQSNKTMNSDQYLDPGPVGIVAVIWLVAVITMIGSGISIVVMLWP